jgi:hypothetical protein
MFPTCPLKRTLDLNKKKVYHRVEKKRLLHYRVSVITILLIPLIAMQLTDEVNWTVLDFVVAAALLFCYGLLIVRVHT